MRQRMVKVMERTKNGAGPKYWSTFCLFAVQKAGWLPVHDDGFSNRSASIVIIIIP